MTTILVITGVILLVAIFGLLYRVITLVGIAKGESKKRVGVSNTVNALLFPISLVAGGLLIIWSYADAREYFLPEAASVHGLETDFLFWLTLGIVFAAFFITHILLFTFPFIYRFKESKTAYFYPHNDKLELVWTVIPAVVMAVLVLLGWLTWRDITSDPPKEDLVEVEIMGKQFNWQVRYPGKDKELGKYDYRKIDATNSMGIDFSDPNSMDDFTPREIHIPKGKNVLLRIRARDVLHSVFMPHFRVKMDAVPGMPTKFWFTPTKSTAEMRAETGNAEFDYELACTEVCGGGHFAMRMKIVVDEPEEYEKWFNEQESWSSLNQDYISSLDLEDKSLVSVK